MKMTAIEIIYPGVAYTSSIYGGYSTNFCLIEFSLIITLQTSPETIDHDFTHPENKQLS